MDSSGMAWHGVATSGGIAEGPARAKLARWPQYDPHGKACVFDAESGLITPRQTVLAQPETKRAETVGIKARYMDPPALAALVKKDAEYWGKIIKAKNITAD
ncbi:MULTISPECIES: hypothetical protein [Cupriavidus]|uniref:hypothetical protein n=1 Tax=Cupriavidus TaxID=106589 RepID=UPI0002F29346|nr:MULTISPECIES: hypothetical protein [Cupriavidus]TPQ35299.1 hypothetical protein C2U69_21150 [Cupriavidus pinatubonensis]